MVKQTKPIGVVLAGGLSRRMNGPEKSLLELNGEPLLQHVITRLSKQLDNIVINANGDESRFSKYNLPIVPDTVGDFAGPLAGVLAAMRWTAANHPSAKSIITAAADTPFFPTDYVSKMIASQATDQTIVLAHSNERRHPVFGLWPIDLANDLEHFLVAEENRKVMLFAQRYNLVKSEFLDQNGIDPFFNINTPQDMEHAEKLMTIS